ncbi:SH2 domain-containing protein 1B isoform X1 [Apteryx rowi]|uniref:SH2 domain-containing protein 1B isoform X1 n=1 Tax=Apteryx rowi TaxID=308060 RepID=UPI000E1D0899|nr:SH2 domain-containing protein 1B isoform X1 [Apteryx rowi]
MKNLYHMLLRTLARFSGAFPKWGRICEKEGKRYPNIIFWHFLGFCVDHQQDWFLEWHHISPVSLELMGFQELIYTYRIFREHQGYFRIQTSEGVPERTFRTLKDLIYTYEKPNQGLVTNLRYPVKKRKPPQRSSRFKSATDDVYDEIEEGDYVEVLP